MEYGLARNNRPLPNLSLARKAAYSALILTGMFCFLAGWAAVFWHVYWDLSDSTLGVALGMLANEHRTEFYVLFALHVFSTALLLIPSLILFSLSSLRRRMRALIRYVVCALVILDISAWLYAPDCSSTNLYVGVVGGAAAIALVAIALTPLVQMWAYRRWEPLDGVRKRVVIVGGGFGGLYSALSLHRILGYHPKLEITLVDQNNYFLFPPLLPSASTGTIEYRQVSYPFRRIFETTNVRFAKLRVTEIDQQDKIVRGFVSEQDRNIEIPFDVLVFSPGAVTQTFGTKGADEHAFFMRELEDAIVLRDRIVDLFEQAAAASQKSEQASLLHFVVVGAGPTGIETATEIADLIKHVLLKRYPEIDASTPKVTIVQSGDRVLPGWDSGIADKTKAQLQRLGIALALGNRVSEVNAEGVVFKDNTTLRAHTVIWCAGVKPSPLVAHSGLATENGGRIPIRPTLQSAEYDHVFVLGDVAHLREEGKEKPLPALAQVAFQQGAHAGKNIAALLSGSPLKNFRYFDYGSLVSVGEHFAAVKIFGISFTGFLAWLTWRTLYLAKLPGLGNRVRVVIDWTLDLLLERSITQTRGAKRSLPSHDEVPEQASSHAMQAQAAVH